MPAPLDLLVLRLEAPLLSFGGTMVDKFGVIEAFPALSMITGLLGNALGYDHREAAKLDRLQSRLRFAARADVPGQKLRDFQTVDLGQPFLEQGWTTRGAPEGRAGGPAKTGTHIRERDYLADATYAVLLTLEPADEHPRLADLEAALKEPERPLFLGRKPCLPSAPIFVRRLTAASWQEALDQQPRLRTAESGGDQLLAWWPTESDDYQRGTRVLPVTDERDWTNQIHVGRRLLREGRVSPPAPEARHGR